MECFLRRVPLEQCEWKPGHRGSRSGQGASRVNMLSKSVAENSGNEKEVNKTECRVMEGLFSAESFKCRAET